MTATGGGEVMKIPTGPYGYYCDNGRDYTRHLIINGNYEVFEARSEGDAIAAVVQLNQQYEEIERLKKIETATKAFFESKSEKQFFVKCSRLAVLLGYPFNKLPGDAFNYD